MIAYIKGKITSCQPTFVVVESSGIGYLIHISLNAYSKLQNLQETTILTHLIIKEDGHYLYGFINEGERSLFIQLISVSGVGPNTARVILSYMNSDEIRTAILHSDDGAFRKVKGVGPKTAQRIIIDLKDKISKDTDSESIMNTDSKTSARSEAVVALVALGFQRQQVEQILRSFTETEKSQYSVEDLIKLCLKKLS